MPERDLEAIKALAQGDRMVRILGGIVFKKKLSGGSIKDLNQDVVTIVLGMNCQV